MIFRYGKIIKNYLGEDYLEYGEIFDSDYQTVFLCNNNYKDVFRSRLEYSSKIIDEAAFTSPLYFEFQNEFNDEEDFISLKKEVFKLIYILKEYFNIAEKFIYCTFDSNNAFYVDILFVVDNGRFFSNILEKFKYIYEIINEIYCFKYLKNDIYTINYMRRIDNTKNSNNNLFCVPISIELLRRITYSELREYAKNKQYRDIFYIKIEEQDWKNGLRELIDIKFDKGQYLWINKNKEISSINEKRNLFLSKVENDELYKKIVDKNKYFYNRSILILNGIKEEERKIYINNVIIAIVNNLIASLYYEKYNINTYYDGNCEDISLDGFIVYKDEDRKGQALFFIDAAEPKIGFEEEFYDPTMAIEEGEDTFNIIINFISFIDYYIDKYNFDIAFHNHKNYISILEVYDKLTLEVCNNNIMRYSLFKFMGDRIGEKQEVLKKMEFLDGTINFLNENYDAFCIDGNTGALYINKNNIIEKEYWMKEDIRKIMKRILMIAH